MKKEISSLENQRKFLLNGCWRTPIKAYPSNWHTKKASLKKDWYVYYRFHDPLHKDLFPDGKLVSVKGMNEHKTLEKRQEVTRLIIQDQLTLTDINNYNHITKRVNLPPKKGELSDGVTPQTLFIDALRAGKLRLKYVHKVLRDIESVINGTEAAAIALGYDKFAISDIDSGHIVLIFDKCRILNPNFSVNRQNRYRSYLMAIFKEIKALKAIKTNIINDVEIATKGTQDIDCIEELADDETIDDDSLLTLEERKEISAHLKENCYTFWRYTHLFFHSASRSTELFRVKESHVDLQKQRFKTLIKKRRRWTWVWRIMKDISVPIWNEILKECEEYRKITGRHAIDPYLFGKGLRPDITAIDADAITRRWARWVQADKYKMIKGKMRPTNGLGIKKGFYDIKALHTTEVMDALDDFSDLAVAEQEMAEMNAHTTTTMVKNVYDRKNGQRKNNRIKGLRNSFA